MSNPNSIIIYNNNLCPEIWDEYFQLRPDIRLNLLNIAKEFYKKTTFEAPIIDILFMGSLASFNWNKQSDIDVHILIDLTKLNMPEETADKMYKVVGSQWNSEHDIQIKNHKVEMNIQPTKVEKPYVNGIYSLIKNQWIKKPSRQDPKAINKSIIQVKYNGLKKYILDTIATNNIDKMKGTKDYIDSFRQYGLDTDGELSVENIVYKLLRTKGILKTLKDSILKTYDQSLSIQESYHDLSSEDEKYNNAVAYFDIGHDEDVDDGEEVPDSYAWIWNGNSVLAKKNTTHGIAFTHDVASANFKGRYDTGKHKVSVVFPDFELRKIGDKRPTVDDIPTNLYNKLISKFGKDNQFVIFENTNPLPADIKTQNFEMKFGDPRINKGAGLILLNGNIWFANAIRMWGDGDWAVNRHTGAWDLKLPDVRQVFKTPEDLLNYLQKWYDETQLKEVNQSDINQTHPRFVVQDKAGIPNLKLLTLDNLKALRNKCVRMAKNIKPDEDKYGIRKRATQDFVLYQNEIKRRLEIINRPLMDEGVGAGIPETDPLHIKGERWRIDWGKRKTPLMK